MLQLGSNPKRSVKRVDFMDKNKISKEEILRMEKEMDTYMQNILVKYSGVLNSMDILNELNNIDIYAMGTNKALFLVTLEFYLQSKCQKQNPLVAFDYIIKKAVTKPKVIDYFLNHDKYFPYYAIHKKATIVQELRNLLDLYKKNIIDLENLFAICYEIYLKADQSQTAFVLADILKLFDSFDKVLLNVSSPDFKDKKERNTIDAKKMTIEWK